jgi:hypothetical protein
MRMRWTGHEASKREAKYIRTEFGRISLQETLLWRRRGREKENNILMNWYIR